MSTSELDTIVSALVMAKLANEHARVREDNCRRWMESEFGECTVCVHLGASTPILEHSDCILPSADLRKILRVKCAAKNYTGTKESVQIVIAGNTARGMATDGRRIAWQTVHGWYTGSAVFRLPFSSSECLYDALARAVGDVQVRVRGGVARFRFEADSNLGPHHVVVESALASTSSDGASVTIPKPNLCRKFSGRQFAEAVDGMWREYRRYGDVNMVAVAIDIGPGYTRFSIGQRTCEIPVLGDGEALLQMNVYFLRDLVAIAGKRSKMTLEVCDADTPVVFRAGDVVYIVNPMVLRTQRLSGKEDWVA